MMRSVLIVALLIGLTASAPAPLILGRWRQNPAECGSARPLIELNFNADGRFSATWSPFETYQDSWGRWSYDARTRAVSLNVEGGNYIPADRAATVHAMVTGDAWRPRKYMRRQQALHAPPVHLHEQLFEIARKTRRVE